ncbi:hypothetical protein PMIN06_012899 [Paraphaeosphaeria minitans]
MTVTVPVPVPALVQDAPIFEPEIQTQRNGQPHRDDQRANHAVKVRPAPPHDQPPSPHVNAVSPQQREERDARVHHRQDARDVV